MVLQLILSILMGFFFGMICSNLARNKGRKPQLWFQLGFFFGILALILLYILLWKEKWSSKPKFAQEGSLAPSSSGAEKGSLITLEKTCMTLEERDWYFLDPQNNQKGPISFDELKTKLSDGILSEKATFLWSEGMDKWKPLIELPYLKMILNGKTTS